jgi:hypothetical protein
MASVISICNIALRWVRPQYAATPDVALLGAKHDDFSFIHKIEGDTIYADIAPALVRYTFQHTDPAKSPSLFVEVLSWHLTTRLAMPLH